MGCFACFDIRKQDKRPLNTDHDGIAIPYRNSIGTPNSNSTTITPPTTPTLSDVASDKATPTIEITDSPKDDGQHIAAQTFIFRELAIATQNFRADCLIGEGGFGRVYKGLLESTGQVVAVKQLDRNGLQGNREFLVEVLMLSLLHHPNLVNLIGYCADGDQRLLVYEYMPLGCLEDHLHDIPPDKEPLDWNTKMKIAAGAARGLEYLHDKANPPVIYRDFKSSNILLDEGFHPKLSDFGLAKLGPIGDKTHVSTRVMGTYGYCAPEYAMTGQLTVKSDVYSFGVVLLEMITGRKAIDNSRGSGEHNLVSWAQPLFKDRKKFHQMVDPSFRGRYPVRGLYQAIAVAAMCLQEDATTRPLIGDVVTALNYLASQKYDPGAHPATRSSPSPSRDKNDRERKVNDGGVVDERGFMDRMFRQGGAQSPASDSPDHRFRDNERVRTRYSPDSRYKETERMLRHPESRSSASNSPDSNARDNVHLKQNRSYGGAGRFSDALSNKTMDGIDRVTSNGHKDSLQQHARSLKSASDRERAVAEARVWGENWRDRKRGVTQSNINNNNNVDAAIF